MKVLLVGRHTPDFGQEKIEVIETKNVQFAAKSDEVRTQLDVLIGSAAEIGCEAVLFQAVPGQLAIALCKEAAQREIDWVENGFEHGIKIGVVISKPAAREAAKTYIVCPDLDRPSEYKNLVKFCNPNARIVELEDSFDSFQVVVDPPMKFEFSHIEWM